MTCPRVPVRDEAGTGADRETVWVWGLHKCWEGWRAGRALLVHLGALQPRGWDLAAEFRAASPRSPECLPRGDCKLCPAPRGQRSLGEDTSCVAPGESPDPKSKGGGGSRSERPRIGRNFQLIQRLRSLLSGSGLHLPDAHGPKF